MLDYSLISAQSTAPQLIIAKIPEQLNKGEAKKWSFSFQYWKEIEFFGHDKTDSQWFVSLLKKLQQLCTEDVDSFLGNSEKLDYWRYHRIKWDQTNIPVKPEDLYWVPNEYIGNQEEFPLVQFKVSLSLGRVIGFWDRDYVFQIVLLDSLHNMQPSKAFNYKVDACSPLGCHYSHVVSELDKFVKCKCKEKECEFAKELFALPDNRNKLESSNVFMLCLTDSDAQFINDIIEAEGANDIYAIFSEGIKACVDKV